MANLRIKNVSVIDSRNIIAEFTDLLYENINISNVELIPTTENISNPIIISVIVDQNILNIEVSPLLELTSYYIIFKSTNNIPFISLNNISRLLEDGISNKYLILSPISPENPVKNFFKSYFYGNIYDVEDNSGLISKYLDGISSVISRALYDIGQVKNENYISFNVIDEIKTRGYGSSDRLNEESAYEIIRVGLTPTNTKAQQTFQYSSFPYYPISLQSQNFSENLSIGNENIISIFNVNDLILNLSNNNIISVNSITFTINLNTYIYDIDKYGYQILESKYDPDKAFKYLLLNSNQIKLSNLILEDSNFNLSQITNININYKYKNLGIYVNENSVVVKSINNVVREVIAPILNVITLTYNNIVDINGNLIELNGLLFFNPNSIDQLTPHPAFKKEIKFSRDSIPSIPGQFSVDYFNGIIYVFGEDLNKTGSGATPPLVSYNYLYNYKNQQDFVYDPTTLELVSLPLGTLRETSSYINFDYEVNLVKDVDFTCNLHSESINERIDNNIIALNSIKSKNYPITNVFKIYNETSGEIYSISHWNKDKIYYNYNTPPRIIDTKNEIVSFENSINEVLFINNQYNNLNLIKIFELNLKNKDLVGFSEDGLAYNRNTSVIFSKTNIFINEKYYDSTQNKNISINKINSVGEYIINYVDGIIYVGVSNVQNNDLGFINYKFSNVKTQNDHLISINNIYFNNKINSNIVFNYNNIENNSFNINNLSKLDEIYKNNSVYNYIINNQVIGILDGLNFIQGVANEVVNIRNIFELNDLKNSINPLNFNLYSTFESNDVMVLPITKNDYYDVMYNITDGYYILLNENIPYFSSNITYTYTVKRSNGQNLYSSGNSVAGSNVKLKLTLNSPQVGEIVMCEYQFTINNLSAIMIDYSKGNLCVDYTYLADEILISYEYGDNVINFNNSTTLTNNEQYYVSYKCGALRDALLNNFGTLVNVPELMTFDLDFNRERYRDAVFAALSSFIQGPTINAIKNIGYNISHITPEINESMFNGWSLGSSILYPQNILSSDSISLLPGKFGNGVSLKNNDYITFPLASNIRLEEGSFESFIIPNWDGVDSNINLTFEILKNNLPINSNNVFVGSFEIHPEINNNKFNISNIDIGKPNKNKNGVYIYLEKDSENNYNKWNINIIDGYQNIPSNYSIKITSNGKFYNGKFDGYYTDSTSFTGNNYVKLNINPTPGLINRKYSFINDTEKYILDFGDSEIKNRLSLYKDVSGNLIFRVIDNFEKIYTIEHNISNWIKNQIHFVAISWKFNSELGRDEMHLFVDGLEIPNIYKYDQNHYYYEDDKFNSISSEYLINKLQRDVISGSDLITTSGNNVVSSSINFGAYNINIGDIIIINEVNFGSYTITNISGQNLTLSSPMPYSLTNVRFTVNRTNINVNSYVATSPNIAVYRSPLFVASKFTGFINTKVLTAIVDVYNLNVRPGDKIALATINRVFNISNVSGSIITLDGYLPIAVSNIDGYIYKSDMIEIPGIRANIPSYDVNLQSYNKHYLNLKNNVFKSDLLRINTLGLNTKNVKFNQYIWSEELENIIKTKLPTPISLDSVNIYKVLLPRTSIGPSNCSLSLGIFTSNLIQITNPINNTKGRTLSVEISGNNVNFATSPIVKIDGYTTSGFISENIIFTNYGKKDTVNLFVSTIQTQVIVRPTNSNKNALVVIIKEKNPITYVENDGYKPVIRYSYQMGDGNKLSTVNGTTLTDLTQVFSQKHINNYINITKPTISSGFFKISSISEDRHSITIQSINPTPTLPLTAFTDGYYTLYNTTDYRSGLQNGYFTFELDGYVHTPYFLSKGYYEFDYQTYLSIPLKPQDVKVYLGSDINKKNSINSILDQVKINYTKLTDTRIGEIIPENQQSITKDFNSIKELKPNVNTTMLLDFNGLPIANKASTYIADNMYKGLFISSEIINDNFDNGVSFDGNYLELENEGILSNSEGTIEMWVNSKFDSSNDPFKRFFVDATSLISEDVISYNNCTIYLNSPAKEILSVNLIYGDKSINYFEGGKLEIDNKKTISEQVVGNMNSVIQVSKSILQVSCVKILGDYQNIDYFDGGTFENNKIYLSKQLPQNNLNLVVVYQPVDNNNSYYNKQVIRLNKKLPNQNTKVKITFIPKGMNGDRISIYKDEYGYLNFSINANKLLNEIRVPIVWSKDSWHRIKASFKTNSNLSDEMRLFVDGYEYTYNNFRPGNDGYLISKSIKFKDPINYIYFGSDFNKNNKFFGIVNNLRISNISRPLYKIFNEAIDVNYTSNLAAAIPVESDLYTTYLLKLNKNKLLSDDFSIIKNRDTGLFNFLVKIIDSYGIINDNIKSKEILEKLINILKPANSKVYIKYIS